MATYTKQTWADDNPAFPVSAARMQHIEDGIYALAQGPGSLFSAKDPAYGTIAAALTAAKAVVAAGTLVGGRPTVYMPAGEYTENIDLANCNKIRLLGDGSEHTIINGAVTGAGSAPSTLGYITLEGFTVDGTGLGINGIDLQYVAGFLALVDVEAYACIDGFKFNNCYGLAGAYRSKARLCTGWGWNLNGVNDEFQLDHCDADTCGVQSARTTGTITIGTNSLVVANAGTIATGDIIIVKNAGTAAATGTGRTHLVTFVTGVAGTTITLNDNAVATATTQEVIAARGGGYRIADLWNGPWVGSKANDCSIGVLLETTAAKNLYNPTFVGGQIEGGAGTTVDSLAGFLSRAAGSKIRGLSVNGLSIRSGYGIGAYLGGLTDATVDLTTNGDGTGLFTHLEIGPDSTDVKARLSQLPAAGETISVDAGVNTQLQDKDGSSILKTYTNLGVFSAKGDANATIVLVRSGTTPGIGFGAGGGATTDVTLRRLAAGTLGFSADSSIWDNLAAPTYSASITPNCQKGTWQTITVTNGTAFTVNAPTNPPDSTHSAKLTIEISNTSGGAMGVITWNAAFVLTGGAFTNPATAKKRLIKFEWNSTAWVETGRASADY